MFACNGQFSMHRGRQCATTYGLLDAGPGGVPKGASPGLGGGANPLFLCRIVLAKRINYVNVCLECPVFNASGVAVCRPPMACRTLGRAARRKARRLALAEALNLSFSVVLCSQNVKMCECLLATPSFQCIRGGSVPPPISLPDAGPGGVH